MDHRRTASDAATDGVRAPGFAALLRRHPRLKQRAALGSIAAGAALFVVASLTTPLYGTAAAPHPRRTVAADTGAGTDLGGLLPLATAAPAPETTDPPVVQALTSKPRHVDRTAPATPAVISGLAANGIPTVALNAYRVAAERMDNADPGCGIDWALLAGIGRVESDHGRVGGAVLHTDGLSTPRIIGPALDGTDWDYVPAPADGEELDGDAVYAHALGPMQFIPQTWAGYGADGNGDGIADVFNIDDAALGAARLLCAAGGDLRTKAGQERAVLTYNHSDEYLAEVLALAAAYRAGIDVTGIPLVGDTTGTLGAVRTTDVPPANPGKPTALGHHKKKQGDDTAAEQGTGQTKTHQSTSAGPGATSGTGSSSPAAPGSSGSSATSGSAGATAPSQPSGGSSSSTSVPVLTQPTQTPTPTPPPTSAPPASAPPRSSSPTPSPTPTKCRLPDPFDKSKCWIR